MANHSIQSSTNCTPALFMLPREIRTPAEDAVNPAGLDYARKLQDRLEKAGIFTRDQWEKAGMKQKGLPGRSARLGLCSKVDLVGSLREWGRGCIGSRVPLVGGKWFLFLMGTG